MPVLGHGSEKAQVASEQCIKKLSYPNSTRYWGVQDWFKNDAALLIHIYLDIQLQICKAFNTDTHSLTHSLTHLMMQARYSNRFYGVILVMKHAALVFLDLLGLELVNLL